MTSILEGELAEIIGDALLDADIPLDIIVTRSTPSVGGDLFDPPPPTLIDYLCKGFVDTYSVLERAGTVIRADDAKIVIIATTIISEPKPGDLVTARGRSYYVINVSTDPARALFELQGRA
jgi:hypothetical protein